MANPVSIRDSRPIACCNVVYKCIPKILAQRMHEVLPLIINKTQSSFIKGRAIEDNVPMMHELVRGYQKDEGPPRCSFNIDLTKAYDSMDWGFLFDVMAAMGFPDMFVNWVEYCVSTPHFSVVIMVDWKASSEGLGVPVCFFL